MPLGLSLLLPNKHPDKVRYICSTWKFLILWIVIKKQKTNLTLNDVLNKKLYATAPNLAANPIAVFKLCSLLIATLTYHAYIYLTQTNNTSPCPNEKVNTWSVYS